MATSNRFVIESAEAESLMSESGLSSVLDLLPSLVRSAQPLARAPISKFPVAAVGLASDGRIFIGVNLEFPGLPLHHSVHAEQFMITNAALHGATRIKYIAVSAAPCGHCRQFLQEIRGAPEIKILITSDLESEEITFRPLSNFLPQRFGPDDLLGKDSPLVLEPRQNGLVLEFDAEDEKIGHCNGYSGLDGWDELKRSALQAADRAHAPYTGCPSGVALKDSEGRVFLGSYVESAAYNPSMMPLQAALVAYVAKGGGSRYEEILAGVLVEKEGPLVGQEATARMLLGSVAPRCEFRVFRCRSLGGKKMGSSACD